MPAANGTSGSRLRAGGASFTRRGVAADVGDGTDGDVIADGQVLREVEHEIRRSIPSWRQYAELRAAFGRALAIHRVDTTIVVRARCVAFSEYDVVWVRTVVWFRGGAKRCRSTCGAVGAAPQEPPLVRSVFGSMHFVHRRAHVEGDGSSFGVQSVVLEGAYEKMQCVAGTMVAFGFLVCAMRAAQDGGPPEVVPRLRGPAVVCGLGGNSIGLCLSRVLRSSSGPIHVIEVEPVVVQVCLEQGLLGSSDARQPTAFVVHLGSLCEKLRCIPRECGMIFMDAFEPTTASMFAPDSAVALSMARLADGGLLVVNQHCGPTRAALRGLGHLFGDGNVHAINIHGWNQSVAVCVKERVGAGGARDHCNLRLLQHVVRQLLRHGEPSHEAGAAPCAWLSLAWVRSIKRSRLVNVAAQGAAPVRVRVWESS